MKLGIKVNADRESFDRLSEADPAACEVWFNANDPDRYVDLFDELKRRRCDVGLHFWGMLDGGTLPNLSYPDRTVIAETRALMRRSVDIARKHGFRYVNIHPGSSAMLKVDYDAQRYDVIRKPVDTDESIGLFLESAHLLSEYAKRHDVVFTVETVPPMITDGWYTPDARLTPKRAFELPVSAVLEAAGRGLSIANDFCHTAANIISDDPSAIWTYLLGITKRLADRTRLIHLGFVVPPFNGTDNHDEFDNPTFDSNQAVPNADQTVELLKLFSNRPDVWILAEPKDHHVKNYRLAKKLLETAGVLT